MAVEYFAGIKTICTAFRTGFDLFSFAPRSCEEIWRNSPKLRDRGRPGAPELVELFGICLCHIPGAPGSPEGVLAYACCLLVVLISPDYAGSLLFALRGYG